MSEVTNVKINACKCTLSTGKVVILRLPVIADTEESARLAGNVADPNNTIHLGMVMQKELVKRLLLQVDERELGLNDKEDLDALFNLKEYTEVQKAVNTLAGTDEAADGGKKSVMEFVPFGNK